MRLIRVLDPLGDDLVEQMRFIDDDEIDIGPLAARQSLSGNDLDGRIRAEPGWSACRTPTQSTPSAENARSHWSTKEILGRITATHLPFASAFFAASTASSCLAPTRRNLNCDARATGSRAGTHLGERPLLVGPKRPKGALCVLIFRDLECSYDANLAAKQISIGKPARLISRGFLRF